MPFLDEIKIHVAAGEGGDGRVSFRREKFVNKGGPDGGDGGRGGNVVIRATTSQSSLEQLASKHNYRSEDGAPGGQANRHGKDGADLIIDVPVGTFVRDAARGNILKDLDRPEAEVIIARGGKGGRGNARFSTSVDRTPRRAEEGEAGEERELLLELKLIADVGLLGYPNAGKSTLLRAISGSSPKVGAHPFTTLTPNLGILEHDFAPYVIADVPGLIEGAHQGRGLGHRFLKHVERTRVLLHLVDGAATDDPLAVWRAVRYEIEAYGETLGARLELLVITKMDLVDAVTRKSLEAEVAASGKTAYFVSAHTKEGLPELIEALVLQVQAARAG